MYNVSANIIEEIKKSIIEQRYDIICVNDNPSLPYKDFIYAKTEINQAFDSILPNKSSFEV